MELDLVGVIQATPDPPGINRSAWMALIAAREDLVLPQPRTVINPFTKKPITTNPPKDSASVFVDGKQMGSFDWSQNEQNIISVWGDLEHVRTIAEEVARELGGRFLTTDGLQQ